MSLFAVVHTPSLQIHLIEASRPALCGTAWVLGVRQEGVRAKVLGVSSGAEALGIEVGMALSELRRTFPAVQVLAPDSGLLSRFRRILSALCDARSSVWEVNDDGDAILDLGAIKHLVGGDLSTWACQFQTDLERAAGVGSARIVFAPNRGGAEILARMPGLPFEHLPEVELEERLGNVSLESIPWLAPATRGRMLRFRLRLLSDVRRVPHAFLCQHFGEVGERLSALARGVDTESPGSSTPTLAAEHVFRREESNYAATRERIHVLADRLSFALRERQLAACEVRLHLSWTDGQELSSTAKAIPALGSFLELRSVAWKLLSELSVRRSSLRSLRLSIPRTQTLAVQEDLFASCGSSGAPSGKSGRLVLARV